MSTQDNGRLGALLNNPVPPADEDPEFAAHQTRKKAADKPKGNAPATAAKRTSRPRKASKAVETAATPEGGLANRGTPAVLPRKRSARTPKDKLTVQVSVTVLDALDALIERDDTRKYDEVEEALRYHLRRKHIEIDKG